MEKQLHVVMFPWLAHGHISPFLELSKRLAHHGVKITFVSTPRNICKIRTSLEHGTTQIDLVELPLPSVDGLPAGAESTADVPNHMEDVLKEALDGLEKPFEHLLHQIHPDYVIYDFSQYWAATVAAKFHIPSIFFLIFTAASSSYFLAPIREKEEETTVEDLTTPPPDYPSSLVVFHPFEARRLLGAFNGNKGEIRVIDRIFKSIRGCDFVAIRSCFEIEAKFISYLEEATGKPVVPVGPLAPDLPRQSYAALSEEDSYYLRWLDKQPPSSVVYVSFGSECFLTEEQIGALAHGLEATGLPFLWALRFPRYSEDNDNDMRKARALLPEGFEWRTRERGVVCFGWVPQLHILSHSSVGVFMSHCGWSSVLEAVKFGVKLVLLPINIDQGLIARLVGRELRVGVEVEREEDGSFGGEQIRTAVVKVMEEDGKEVDFHINQIRGSIFGESGCEERYLTEFAQRLRYPIHRN